MAGARTAVNAAPGPRGWRDFSSIGARLLMSSTVAFFLVSLSAMSHAPAPTSRAAPRVAVAGGGYYTYSSMRPAQHLASLLITRRLASDSRPLPHRDVFGPACVLSREEMSELQKQLARWTTEPKQFADTEAGSGQRILDEDKGAHAHSPGTLFPVPPHARPRRREPATSSRGALRDPRGGRDAEPAREGGIAAA